MTVRHPTASADIKAEDVEDWDLCHECGGNLEGSNVTIEGRYAYQEVTCMGDCPTRSWTEIYTADMRMVNP